MLVHFFQALIVISILFGSTADLVGQQKEIWEPKNIGQYKSTFNYKGIFQQYRILCRTFGDLDKDGHQEVIIGYGPRDEEIQPWGGVLILEESSHRKNYKKVFHALFEHIFPKKISATGSNLNITMVKVTDEGEKIHPLLWVHGQDFGFLGTDQSITSLASVTASSYLTEGEVEYSAQNLIDNNPNSSWAENLPGTGLESSFIIQFGKNVNLAMVGILPGKTKEFYKYHRPHRLEMSIRKGEDQTNSDDEDDLMDSLGQDLDSEEQEFVLPNKSNMRYFLVPQQDVVSLKFIIKSVYLGKEDDGDQWPKDHTFLSEIDVVEFIPVSRTIEAGKKPSPKERVRSSKDKKNKKRSKQKSTPRILLKKLSDLQGEPEEDEFPEDFFDDEEKMADEDKTKRTSEKTPGKKNSQKGIKTKAKKNKKDEPRLEFDAIDLSD